MKKKQNNLEDFEQKMGLAISETFMDRYCELNGSDPTPHEFEAQDFEEDVMKKLKPLILNQEKALLKKQREDIVEIIKEMPKKHYAKWIPTKEQKGYMKACVDIINSLNK